MRVASFQLAFRKPPMPLLKAPICSWISLRDWPPRAPMAAPSSRSSTGKPSRIVISSWIR
ncbi:hypothetical protein D3C73_1421590 [compost metagenome]